jgi:hypothetical protein
MVGEVVWRFGKVGALCCCGGCCFGGALGGGVRLWILLGVVVRLLRDCVGMAKVLDSLYGGVGGENSN